MNRGVWSTEIRGSAFISVRECFVLISSLVGSPAIPILEREMTAEQIEHHKSEEARLFPLAQNLWEKTEENMRSGTGTWDEDSGSALDIHNKATFHRKERKNLEKKIKPLLKTPELPAGLVLEDMRASG